MGTGVLLCGIEEAHGVLLCPLRQIPRTPVHQIFALQVGPVLKPLMPDAGFCGAIDALPGNVVHPLPGHAVAAAALVRGTGKMGSGDSAPPGFQRGERGHISWRYAYYTVVPNVPVGHTPPPRWAQPCTDMPGVPPTSLSNPSNTATGSGVSTCLESAAKSPASVVSSR